ncbi:MAG TPA: tetratricopeptide repeat protein [Gemmataceae bacterium]|jgi:tetratricopeptide (TPR) repeat protein
MLKEKSQDRDAIVSKAIGIESAQERDAYIDQACDNDADLKRQVEEKVAAQLKARGQEKPDRKADPDSSSSEKTPKEASEKAEENQAKPQGLWATARQHPRASSLAAIIGLLLLAVAVAGAGVAWWALHKEGQASKAKQQAIEKSKKAQKAEEESKGKLEQSEAARKIVEKERDRARTAEKAARRSEEERKAVLQFVRKKLLAAGRPEGSIAKDFWAGGQGKDVTLRHALDAAASQVADAFADRPGAETSVREMLGMAYLNVGEPKQAVEQYERALALHEAMQGVNDSATAACRNQLAVAYRRAGRTADASRLIDRKPNSPDHAAALAVRGTMLLSQKKPVEAELKLRECLNIREKIQPDDWSTFDAKSLLGEALSEQKKYADAEPLLVAGYKGLKKHADQIPAADKDRLTKAIDRLVRLYEAWDKKDEAARWRKEREASKAAKES